jgi:hypothetical protein
MAVNHWRQERIWGQQKARALQENALQPRGLQECSPPENASLEIHQPQSRIATLMNVTEMRYDRQVGPGFRGTESRTKAYLHEPAN